MKNTIRSLAVVAAAALSLPVLAAEPSSITGDPTWPAIENPAPAVALNGAEAPAPVDITQIEIVGKTPKKRHGAVIMAVDQSGHQELSVRIDERGPLCRGHPARFPKVADDAVRNPVNEIENAS